MTEQVLRALFDFQKFSGNRKLEAVIQDTQSRQAAALTESELEFVNAAGVPEIMGLQGGEGSDDKDDPWKQH